jgi:hypothetical protein
MNQKVRVLVLEAVQSCGRSSIKNIMLHIEESLTSDEVKEVRAFLKWAFFDWENRGFGPLNIDSRYNEWKMSLGPVSIKKKVSSMFGKTYSRSDGKAMTVKELFALLTKLNQDSKMTSKVLDSPVVVSSDEEGNDMQELAFVEVSRSGVVSLYPAHF